VKITIQTDAKKLMETLAKVSENINKELKSVNWKTAKRAQSLMAKEIGAVLPVPQRDIKQYMRVKKHGENGAAVELKKSNRIPLRDFKAKQTRKGVSYRASKIVGRRTITQAFQGPKRGVINPKWNGRVFGRLPNKMMKSNPKKQAITQLFGPSPWGVYVVNKLKVPTTRAVQAELKKQLLKRIQWRTLKTNQGR
jgi:hypothetical protein